MSDTVITRIECPEHGDDVSWWASSGPLGCNQCQRSGSRLVTVEYVRVEQPQRAVEALRELVRLKDGPRDDAYRAAKDSAWDAAREVLNAR